jgi:protoheme IX farnesyltransferase
MSSPALVARRSAGLDFAELTKPRITMMVMFTALVGYVMASTNGIDVAGLAWMLAGTGLVAAGASVLNMVLERRTDGLMHRTRERPIPTGRLRPLEASLFGLTLTTLGLALLAWLSGTTAAGVALVSWISYVFFYTPLKTRTSLSTIVGAFPGALPPVIGWAAARGTIDPGAYVLFAMLFLWQIPHFLAIAWIYREDYARGGLPMLPVVDPEGRMTGRQAVANSIALLLVSLAPAAAGMAGRIYLAGAIILGLLLTAAAVRAAVVRSLASARTLFLASIVYLATLDALLLADRL